jgi:hypothetical protein
MAVSEARAHQKAYLMARETGAPSPDPVRAGDLVLVTPEPKPRSKVNSRMWGPFLVVEAEQTYAVVLRDLWDTRRRVKVHRGRVCLLRTDEYTRADQLVGLRGQDMGVYTVKEVLGHRVERRGDTDHLLLRVTWVGFDGTYEEEYEEVLDTFPVKQYPQAQQSRGAADWLRLCGSE